MEMRFVKLTLCASLLNISSLIVELLSFSFSVYSFLFLLFCFVSSLLRIREMEKGFKNNEKHIVMHKKQEN